MVRTQVLALYTEIAASIACIAAAAAAAAAALSVTSWFSRHTASLDPGGLVYTWRE